MEDMAARVLSRTCSTAKSTWAAAEAEETEVSNGIVMG